MAKKNLVMAFGTFDLLHPGHQYYLQKARELGTELVVVVARDSSVEKLKGRKPVFSEKERMQMVSSLKFVEKAVLGHDFLKDKAQIIREIWPDIIALGYDQKPSDEQLKKELEKISWKGKIVRIASFKPELFKTSRIRKTIESNY